MSNQTIADALTAARTKIQAAYTKCNDKGATMPQTQDLSNLANCIDSISGGGTQPKYTGHVDTVGLQALGWDEYDIAWLQDNVWWNAEDDEFWEVTEANLEFGPNGSNALDWNNYSAQKTNSDLRFFPKLDKSSGGNFTNLFNGYNHIVAIPTHGWAKNGSVTAMISIFSNCYSLHSCGDLSEWNVSSCTSMLSAFNNCNMLTFIGDLSNWDTSSLTNTSGMFTSCYNLESVDVSAFDMSNVTTCSSMFTSCYSLKSVGDLSEWDVSDVKNMEYMFNQCYRLVRIGDLSDWDTGNVTAMQSMFSNCLNLTDIGDLSDWDTAKVTNMSSMFTACRYLRNITGISSWDVSKVTTVNGTFARCFPLKELDLRGWDLSSCSNVGTSNMTSVFFSCDDLMVLKLGKNFFNGSATTYYFESLLAWTKESVYESLYTNQTLRDGTSPAITVRLGSTVYNSLSQQERDDIATKKITLVSV